MQQKNQHSPTPRKFLRVGRGFHYLHNLDRLGLLTQWDTYLQEGCNINQDSHRQEVIGNPKRYRTSASGTRASRDHPGGFHYLHNLDHLGLLTQWDTYIQED